MKRTYGIESTALVRQVFLRQLAGDELNHAERTLLANAHKSASLKRMIDELKTLYNSPEMLALLRERPNSERLEELMNRALDVRSRKYKVHFIKRILAVFC